MRTRRTHNPVWVYLPYTGGSDPNKIGFRKKKRTDLNQIEQAYVDAWETEPPVDADIKRTGLQLIAHYKEVAMNQRDSNVPASDEQKLEEQIKKLGADVAPRVTGDHIDSLIVGTAFHVFSGSLLTVCVLTLKNGFTVSGESACASPENFNAEIGEGIAKRNARDKIWSLEGYLLKQKLYENAQGDFLSRLQREFEELSERTKKLFAFLGTPIFKGLPEQDQIDLEDQYLTMQSYCGILTRRLARLGK